MNHPHDEQHGASSSSSRSLPASGGVTSSANTTAAALDPHDNKTNKNDDSSPWTLQIKTVGEQQPDFCVTVHPADPVSRLYDAIGQHTGWTHREQRLIYRGRLLHGDAATTNNNNNRNNDSSRRGGEQPPAAPSNKDPPQLRDIVGLTDGHTIHLVRRKLPQEEEEESAAENATATTSSSNNNNASSSSSLLAALLGMGGGGTGSSSNNNNNNTNNSRRVPYRLQESDLERPDPGSLESVRQGLLTLHTMDSHSTSSSARPRRRQFYRGQWIDCRDTVNQWLEATVVDIVYPHEILRGYGAVEEDDENAIHATTVSPTSDPAIAVLDLEGRRRLLLEPCSEEDSEEQIDGMHYRRRRGDISSGSNSVQLLHIHYNGWPVRWDEWIRSDSERIRPFRVRTRHASSSAYASPTVATAMAEPPSTRFTMTTSGNNSSDDDDDDEDDDEANDRRVLLPELHRAWNRVHDRLERAVAHNHYHHPSGGAAAPVVVEPRDDLPWRGTAAPSTTNDTTTSSSSIAARRQELEELAPLLDRLGRILTDAAPHVAALAASMAEPPPPEAAAAEDSDESESGGGGGSASSSHPHTLGGLLSLLSRGDHRRRGPHNSHEPQSVASSNAAVPAGDVSASLASSTNEHASVTVHTEEDEEATEVGGEATVVPTRPVDPDLSDYATGFVNTTRGELRSGPRGSRSGGSNGGSDDLAGLLGAWLAAASLGGITSIGGGGGGGGGGTGEGGDDNDAAAAEGLGRLLRDRGNGGGIDIHIHAVVTAPGGPAGGMAGLGTAGTATPPTTTNATTVTGGGLGNLFASLPPSPRRSPRRFRSSNASHTSSSLPSTHDDDEDDMGIFADLYSENPDPVNPNRPDTEAPDSLPSRASTTTTGATTTTSETTADEVGVLPSTSTHSSRSGRSSRRRNNNDSSRGSGGLGRFFRRSHHG